MEILFNRLQLSIDKYYATEIDEAAKIITSAHFGNKVTQLGNVKNITEDVIEALCPIDLLIGGTPCQDLSSANPSRDAFGNEN